MRINIKKTIHRLGTFIFFRIKRFFQLFAEAGKSFTLARGNEAAAGIAYYALFSLFPILLVFISAGSYFLDKDFIRQQVIQIIPELFPVIQESILRNIQSVLDSRGAFTVVGGVGLLWSATSVFHLLSVNVNRAWIKANDRSFIRRRLLALAIVAVFFILLLLLMLVNRLSALIMHFEVKWIDLNLFGSSFWQQFSDTIVFLFKLTVFFLLYWWIPNIKVHKRAALMGSIFSSVALEVIRIGVEELIGLGWIRYEFLYGTIGTIITLLFWIYLMSWVILFGAHISALIDQRLYFAEEQDGDND